MKISVLAGFCLFLYVILIYGVGKTTVFKGEAKND